MLERRSVVRTEARIKVQVSAAGVINFVEIYDISTDGCMIQSHHLGALEGDTILIRFQDGVSVQGRIIWRRNMDAGVKFTEPLQNAVAALTAFNKACETFVAARSERTLCATAPSTPHGHPGEFSPLS